MRDRDLRRRLTPDYQAMCKRIVASGHYYQSVQKPGVEVIDDAIDHIEPGGVVTADGTLHELDLLVLATGFDAHAYVRPMNITGENGLTLDEAWADGPRAYRSVAVPGFPNLFMLMGPHSPIGNQSLVIIAEDQADYAMWWINEIREGRIVSAAPTDVATKDYNEQVKAALPQTVWATGCKSWYIGKDGLPELFPWNPVRHRELLASPRARRFRRPYRLNVTAATLLPLVIRATQVGSLPAGTAVSSLLTTRVCSKRKSWKEQRCSNSSFSALSLSYSSPPSGCRIRRAPTDAGTGANPGHGR